MGAQISRLSGARCAGIVDYLKSEGIFGISCSDNSGMQLVRKKIC